MKLLVAAALVATAALAGCQKKEEVPAGASPAGLFGRSGGRFIGVGHYTPGRLWAQLARPASTDPAAGRLDDDDEIIVVLDSRTGEVRQCGNLSGHCIAMNPWAQPAVQVQLQKHNEDLRNEEAAKAEADAKAIHADLNRKLK